MFFPAFYFGANNPQSPDLDRDPNAFFGKTYASGRYRVPSLHHPMQSALDYVWAGANPGAWDPLTAYRGYPAAPRLSPQREGVYMRTSAVHSDQGYQMVLLKDNGVPVGATPGSTPNLVKAGPIHSGFTAPVQPVLRREQLGPVANPGRRRNQEDDGEIEEIVVTGTRRARRRPVWTRGYNPAGPFPLSGCGPGQTICYDKDGKQSCCLVSSSVSQGAFPTRKRMRRARRRARRRNPEAQLELASPLNIIASENAQGYGACGGSSQGWPFIRQPEGFQVVAMNEGWPVYGYRIQAPPAMPIEVPELPERADTNPSLPPALAGIPLAAASAGAGALAAGATAFATRATKREEVEQPLKVKQVQVIPQALPTPSDPLRVKVTRATMNPQANPAWPWILGGTALAGAAALGIVNHCAAGERLHTVDSIPGATVSRHLEYKGCFTDMPWRASKVVTISAPGVEPVRQTRAFDDKDDAMAWLYEDEATEMDDNHASNPNNRPATGRPFGVQTVPWHWGGVGVPSVPYYPNTANDERNGPVNYGTFNPQGRTHMLEAMRAMNPAMVTRRRAKREAMHRAYAYRTPPTEPRLGAGKCPEGQVWCPLGIGDRGSCCSDCDAPLCGAGGYTSVPQSPYPGAAPGHGMARRFRPGARRVARRANPVGYGVGMQSVQQYAFPGGGLVAGESAVQQTSGLRRLNPMPGSEMSGYQRAYNPGSVHVRGRHPAGMRMSNPSVAVTNPGCGCPLSNPSIPARHAVAQHAHMRGRPLPFGAQRQWGGFQSHDRINAAKVINPDACCDSCAMGGHCEGGCDPENCNCGKA